MYCPRCAAQNVDDARFCRVCGADIHLVPQALTGSLPVAVAEPEDISGRRSRRHKRREREPPTLEAGVRNIFVGIAFLFVSLAVNFIFPGGSRWWFWLLIPAFAAAGEGVGQIMRVRREQESLALPSRPAAPAFNEVSPAPRLNELPPRDTSEILMPPASITEGTTRHLDSSGQAQSLEARSRERPSER